MTPDELWLWRCGPCPHKETITGLRSECLPCLSDLLRAAEIEALESIRSRLPGGSICDPQDIADMIDSEVERLKKEAGA
ncbi:MAG TPA: hypothetical protein VJ547_11935 [Candidatus Thermoplasmatota archaeon]|nr:hypothetical protein [Candidatus Thermoplasmatota archaeon]